MLIGEGVVMVRVPVAVEVVTPAATNNISSTLVRKQLRENRSVKYLVSDGVAEYIAAEKLASYSQWQ